MKRILVLNPNSSAAVTARMEEGCRSVAIHPGHEVVFHTLDRGPAVIETQRDVESVVLPTCDHFLAHRADAYVIGCFSDPGLHLAREEVAAPVLGLAESAFTLATGLAGNVGIVSIKPGSFDRHARAVRMLGLSHRLAGDRALDLGVTELLDEDRSIARIVEVGRRLRDEDGAAVLVLGCATMGSYRSRVEERLGIPVVDPTQAAVARASMMLSLHHRPAG